MFLISDFYLLKPGSLVLIKKLDHSNLIHTLPENRGGKTNQLIQYIDIEIITVLYIKGKIIN